jgi:putative ABC transport system substrate-binding protein
MRRRKFISLLGGAAAAWPLATTGPGIAQQSMKIARVGILTPAATDATPAFEAFRKGIRDLGYVEGQTIMFDFRFARGNLDALPNLAAELVRTAVEIATN